MRKNSSASLDQLSPVAIERVALGVRFEPRFEVMDHVGALTDTVLRAPDTPFGPATFPVTQSGPAQRILLNTETNDRMVFTQKNCILEMQLDTSNLSRVVDLADNFQTFALAPLRKICNVRDVERYGLLIRLAECREKLSRTPIDHFVKPDFDTARSVAVRFTRRLPSLEAYARKEVDDYRNAIYAIDQLEDGDVMISIDYQEYFQPVLSSEEWKRKPFPDFGKRAVAYFEGEFLTWFSKLRRSSEAA